MAKDGTNRGGRRVGSGRKKRDAHDLLAEGKKASIFVLPDPENPPIEDTGTPEDLDAEEAPDVDEYMTAPQRDGSTLYAKEIYQKTWQWLKRRNADAYIERTQVKHYAMNAARWIQAEKALSEFGLLSKHPTTAQPIQSPFVGISNNYSKLVDAEWNTILQLVRENCTQEVGADPRDSIMSSLLTM